MKKKLIIIIIVLWLSVNIAHACCVSFGDFEETLYDSYDTIFIGKEKDRTPISIWKDNYPYNAFQNNTTIKLEVLEPIKWTKAGDIITIQTSENTSCGFSIWDGSGLVYLGKDNKYGIYNASCCNQITSNDTDRFNRTMNILYYKLNNPIETKISYYIRQVQYTYRSIITKVDFSIQNFLKYFW